MHACMHVSRRAAREGSGSKACDKRTLGLMHLREGAGRHGLNDFENTNGVIDGRHGESAICAGFSSRGEGTKKNRKLKKKKSNRNAGQRTDDFQEAFVVAEHRSPKIPISTIGAPSHSRQAADKKNLRRKRATHATQRDPSQTHDFTHKEPTEGTRHHAKKEEEKNWTSSSVRSAGCSPLSCAAARELMARPKPAIENYFIAWSWAWAVCAAVIRCHARL
jgi:hypothetical protein